MLSVAGVPEVRYAGRGGSAVAYQVWGGGSVDILLMTNWPTSVDNAWEHPGRVRFLEMHGALGRVARFDPRGLGASDPLPVQNVGDLSAWVTDARSVLDELGIDGAVVVGEAFASHAALRLAVEDSRVERLALWNGYARLPRADDYPIGHPAETIAAYIEHIRVGWGTGAATAARVPNLAMGAPDVGFLGRTERLGASRAVAAAAATAEFRSDVDALLPKVEVPTLVVHTGDFRMIEAAHCEYLAERIAGARLIKAPSRSFYWGESGYDDYAGFISVTAPQVSSREIAAILITDIVDSTPAVAALRDGRWRQLLDGLDAFVSLEATRTGGRYVKHLGDGHLIVFSDPGAAVNLALRALRTAPTFEVSLRAGIHFGEIELRQAGDIAGIAVHTARRVADLATADTVLVSRTVADILAGSGTIFDDRGEFTLKGVEGSWRLFEAHE